MKLHRKLLGAFCCLVAEICNFWKCSHRIKRPGLTASKRSSLSWVVPDSQSHKVSSSNEIKTPHSKMWLPTTFQHFQQRRKQRSKERKKFLLPIIVAVYDCRKGVTTHRNQMQSLAKTKNKPACEWLDTLIYVLHHLPFSLWVLRTDDMLTHKVVSKPFHFPLQNMQTNARYLNRK